MNSKIWIRKALSMCSMVAVLATYSMVALAGTEKVAGELLVSGKNINGVTVNGETAQSGRSIFTSSTITTAKDASAIINLGKVGKIELAPNTIIALSFTDKNISGDLLAGRVTVLNASDSVSVKTQDGKMLQLGIGESAATAAQDDDDDDDDGPGWWVWALIFGGALGGIVIAAISDNNRIALGGNTTVVSPTR